MAHQRGYAKGYGDAQGHQLLTVALFRVERNTPIKIKAAAPTLKGDKLSLPTANANKAAITG